MISWIRRIFQSQPATEPLRGAQKVRREKTYSADTGYVYQYYYEGYRESRRDNLEGQDHVFTVTSDRVTRFPVTVFLSRRAVEAWQQAHDRELTATEQYAVVKLSLFQAFDERERLDRGSDAVIVSEAEVEEHCSTLDL